MPMKFCWDNEDPRVLACEIRDLSNQTEKRPPTSLSTMNTTDQTPSSAHAVNNEPSSDSQIVILFTTNDIRNEVKLMEVINLDFEEQLLDMHAPNVVSRTKKNYFTGKSIFATEKYFLERKTFPQKKPCSSSTISFPDHAQSWSNSKENSQ